MVLLVGSLHRCDWKTACSEYKGPESHFFRTPVTMPTLNLSLRCINSQVYRTLQEITDVKVISAPVKYQEAIIRIVMSFKHTYIKDWVAFNVISTPLLLSLALVATYLTLTLILGERCQINNANYYQLLHNVWS